MFHSRTQGVADFYVVKLHAPRSGCNLRWSNSSSVKRVLMTECFLGPGAYLMGGSKGSGLFVLDRQCVQRGRPLGDEGWVESIVRRLGLESTMRPGGRQRVRSVPEEEIKEA